MKNFIHPILLLLLTFTNVNCYAQLPTFTKTYIANDGTRDNLSAYFITEYHGNATFHEGYLQVATVDDGNGTILGAKLTATDANGNTSWSKMISCEYMLRLFAITYDDRDNSYILTGFAVVPVTALSTCVVVLKIDSYGNPLWIRAYRSPAALCAQCYTDWSPAFICGTDILKVQHDPAPNSSTEDFVIIGYLTEGGVYSAFQSFTITKRNFIWRFKVPLKADPLLQTVYFKTYHGGYYNNFSGTFEPTNFDVALSVKEIPGEGLFVTGTTKDTGQYGACNSNVSSQWSSAYSAYWGMINYNGGGGVNTGAALFKYAYYSKGPHSANAVRLLPDVTQDVGYILCNNNDRHIFELYPIRLSTGLSLFQPARIFYGTRSNIWDLVGTNILDYDSKKIAVTGYFRLKGNINPFTTLIDRNTYQASYLHFNKINSAAYINYIPTGAVYDFFKTSTFWCTEDTMRSVITPISGISNAFLGYNDIVTTSPHYVSYNTVDSTLSQALTLFENDTVISCNPRMDSLNVLHTPDTLIDYRAIALVDTISPLTISKPIILETRENDLEMNCIDMPGAYKLARMHSIQTKNDQLTIYPSPTNGTIYFSNAQWSHAAIYNIQGQQLIKLDAPVSSLDITRLAAGVYFIEVSSEYKSKRSFKVIKQ